MNNYLKEALLWILVLLPYAYLAILWNSLPQIVPTHFNIEGVADDWSDKSTLIFLPGAMSLGMYILMLVIPFIDPKKKLQQMGAKYYSLRLMLTLFFSLLAIYLLYLSSAGNEMRPNMLLALIGALFAMFGNYFQAVRPNYFIGLRTPWTLENETVWKNTHRLGGRLWMGGGILIAIFSIFIKNNSALSILFGSIITVLVVVPFVYSFYEFKRIKKMQNR